MILNFFTGLVVYELFYGLVGSANRLTSPLLTNFDGKHTPCILSSFPVTIKYIYSSFDNEDDFPMSFEDELAMLDGMEAEMPSDIGTELIGQVSITISLYLIHLHSQ